MTGFPTAHRSTRRFGLAVGLGVVAMMSVASPASAHHDPDQLAATEAAAEALDISTPAPGLPIGLVVGAYLLIVLALVVLQGRRLRVPTRRLVALFTVGSLLALPLAASPAGAATVLLPDLISDQPTPSGSVEVNTYTGTPRLILRFDGYVTNVGAGPLEVSGNPQITSALNSAAVHQRAIDSSGNWSVVGTPLVQYETADGHNHFHLMQVGRYSLWNQSKTAEAAPGQKIGFCLYDIERAQAEDYSGSLKPRVYSGTVTQFCDSNNPSTTDLVMGTSSGWRDVYGAYLTFQWIDVSETAPGTYYLANQADPYNRIVESNETNNQVGFSLQTSTIPGYNALPVGPVSTLGVPVDVTLASQSFGSPGSRRFQIVTPPTHGSLNVAVGASLTSPTVTYTPTPGYSGPDSFEYVARDSASNFPLNPTRAAASITVGQVPGPSVDISGAPASLIAGTSAALTATVSNAPGGVAWSVNGVAGGNATVGTISSAGLYVAPLSVPGGGSVTVRASLISAPAVFDEVVIRIDPIPNTAPDVTQPDDQFSTAGDAVSFGIEANDPDGDPFTFAAVGLPTGLSIHPTTGLITGSPSVAGTSVVTVTVDDGTDATQVSFDWTIDLRAVVTPGIAVVAEGNTGSRVVSVPVTLNAPVSRRVTVDWTTVVTGGAGIANAADYAAASGKVTFAPGATTAKVDITVYGDTVDEPPAWLGEWGIISFSSPSPNASLNTVFYGLGIFVIIDDD